MKILDNNENKRKEEPKMKNKDLNKAIDIEGLDIYKVDTSTMLEKMGASVGWNSCSHITTGRG
ncbi:hypothetical protein EFM06_06675 [Lactobacillus helveticus]|uniref:hypothetical protein n=1 Tax=Lactobacillus helveticus TaxID=1587 RepID=UPI0021823EBB|nr:hypothetical protein [Lactobacillus helveticus]MCT0191891.1 hypothetical protein [Lactobacillus helveticus]MCT0197409.1 hypothetical protein [Lactobacillus helveticus]